MPIKAVFNEKHEAALVEYDERPLAPNEVRIQTEYASGEYGTSLVIVAGRNDTGQRWHDKICLLVPTDEPAAENLLASVDVAIGLSARYVGLQSSIRWMRVPRFGIWW